MYRSGLMKEYVVPNKSMMCQMKSQNKKVEWSNSKMSNIKSTFLFIVFENDWCKQTPNEKELSYLIVKKNYNKGY